MNRLNSTMPTTSAASGMTKASARLAIHSSAGRYPLAARIVPTSGLLTVSVMSRLPRPAPASGCRADDALDEIVHTFELDGGLDEGLAFGRDDGALVALQRSLDDGE